MNELALEGVGVGQRENSRGPTGGEETSPDRSRRGDNFPDTGGLEGASCHGCLLISEPSCERMNVYLDRSLVVPTIEIGDAAFFGGG